MLVSRRLYYPRYFRIIVNLQRINSAIVIQKWWRRLKMKTLYNILLNMMGIKINKEIICR